MNLNEFKSGDAVEVRMLTPKTDFKEYEWRDGTVVGVQMIHPSNGSRHKPYPMVVVRTTRTYAKTTPKYRYLKGNVKRIKVFTDYKVELYDKENTEGFIYETQIKLKS